MAVHRDLVDSELHEPKGASSAEAGQVYVSDGAGSGTWTHGPYSGHGGMIICTPDATTTAAKVLTIPASVAGASNATKVVFSSVEEHGAGVVNADSNAAMTSIQVSKTGHYLVNFGLTVKLRDAVVASPWGNSETLTLRLYKNGAIVDGACYRIDLPADFTTDLDDLMETGAISQITDLAANDVLDVRLASLTTATGVYIASARTVEIWHGRFGVVPIG